jgi:hypothetical protein
MDYEARLLELHGVRLGADGGEPHVLRTVYCQSQQAPDEVNPSTYVRRRPVRWTPRRAGVRREQGRRIGLTVSAFPARYFGLAPLRTGQPLLAHEWTGEIDEIDPSFAGSPTRARWDDTLGVPAFRFDDVEVLGFRIELDRRDPLLGAKLEKLVEPLNFHLAEARAFEPGRVAAPHAGPVRVPDFRYRAATRTLVVEILRYGKMRLRYPLPPLREIDYQSQHELLVRVLVGRVDDDTAQARSPAVYVPAIFVDNPWSKVLGRDVLGYDKRLARFCVGPASARRPLRPDGVHPDRPGDGPVPLLDLREIALVRRTDAPPEAPLLELDPSSVRSEGRFEKVDLQLALASAALRIARWSQDDFVAREFRRTFARSALTGSLRAFRSIQAAPVGARQLVPSWVTGTFEADPGVRAALPSGIARLTVHAPADAPEGWRALCALVGASPGNPRTLAFSTGGWYRLRSSMNLTIDALE